MPIPDSLKIAHGFSRGLHVERVQSPVRDERTVRSSLRDFSIYNHLYPALKGWAIAGSKAKAGNIFPSYLSESQRTSMHRRLLGPPAREQKERKEIHRIKSGE